MKKTLAKISLFILFTIFNIVPASFLFNIQKANAYDICAITLHNGSRGQQKAASIYPSGEQPNVPPYWKFKEGASSVKIVVETDYCAGKKITFKLYEEDGWGIKNDNEIDIKDEKGNPWDGTITVPSTGAFTINLTANEEFCDNNWGFDCHWYFTLETEHGNNYDSLGNDGGDLYTECDGGCDWSTGNDLGFTYKGITENTRTSPQPPEHWYYKKINLNFVGINGGHDNSKAYLNGIFPSLIECKKAATVALGREAVDTDCIKDGDPFPISPQSVYSDKQYNYGTTGVTPPVSSIGVDSVKITPYNSDYHLLAPIGDLNTIDAKTSIGDYLNIIFKIAIGLMGALAVIMIVIHGIQYMGDESVFGKTEAKHSIMTTIGGLLLALCAYALLNTINPDLLGGDGVYVEPITIQVRNSYEERLSRTQKTDVVFKRSKYYDDIKKFVNNSSYTGHPKKIHHCLLQVAIQRESDSGKTFEVVGHDEDVAGPRGSIKARDVFIDSGKKFNGVTFAAGDSKLQIDSSHLNSDHGNKTIYSAPNPSADDLGLDWRFSHSVGILGETLFPLNESNRGQTYKQGIITSITKKRILPIKKIFDPATVIEVATEKMQFNFSRPSCNGDIEKTYRAYGSGNCNYKGTPGDFLNREAPLRKNLYDQCLAQDK